MKTSNRRKQTLYFTDAMLNEVFREAHRLERSQSWIVQKAWMLARAEIMKAPPRTDVVSEFLAT